MSNAREVSGLEGGSPDVGGVSLEELARAKPLRWAAIFAGEGVTSPSSSVSLKDIV